MNSNNFGLTKENLEKSERKVPIFSILETLTDEQKKQIDSDMIRFSLLTDIQKQTVQYALDLDRYLEKTGQITNSEVSAIINKSV